MDEKLVGLERKTRPCHLLRDARLRDDRECEVVPVAAVVAHLIVVGANGEG